MEPANHILTAIESPCSEHPWRHFDVSRCLSHSERISAEDQEMQDDLKEPSNLEELRHSFQRAMDKLVKDIELTLQETQNNDNKRHRKQQQVKMQGASSDIPTSYFISDNTTENMDARSHTAHLDGMGRTSVLQPEVSTNVEEQKELCCMQVTAADIELQRMWCNFVLAEQKYEYEEIMAQIHHQCGWCYCAVRNSNSYMEKDGSVEQ
ncbi:uncharacterized protein LOC101751252 isoform X4 [Gallus gallus]|uniref:uncharacterized protein LOC101751252 isoform X4 n=1 Tax=Gallus gallus TaxID=9031 RepID=UPI001AE55DE5|nr:uncharacterized protein LOC101751252 isoform X4 [Gallus gallus]